MSAEASDLAKTRALLDLVSETDGSVTLAGQAAATVADAIRDVERLRVELAATVADRDRLQRLCDKTALAAANRALNSPGVW